MRGRGRQTGQLFSYVSPEALVPPDHPLRAIKRLTDAALDRLCGDFAAMCATTGRPSIPPEKLMRALLLQAFFSVRSERQLMQQITYNMLFRWFIGLAMDAGVGRDRLHQEPRPLAGRGHRRPVPRRHPGRSAGGCAALVGAFLGRWHAHRGVGEHEELPPEGRQRRAARPWTQRRARLPRREAEQCDARLDHRCRCQAVPQILRPAGTALPYWGTC